MQLSLKSWVRCHGIDHGDVCLALLTLALLCPCCCRSCGNRAVEALVLLLWCWCFVCIAVSLFALLLCWLLCCSVVALLLDCLCCFFISWIAASSFALLLWYCDKSVGAGAMEFGRCCFCYITSMTLKLMLLHSVLALLWCWCWVVAVLVCCSNELVC